MIFCFELDCQFGFISLENDMEFFSMLVILLSWSFCNNSGWNGDPEEFLRQSDKLLREGVSPTTCASFRPQTFLSNFC